MNTVLCARQKNWRRETDKRNETCLQYVNSWRWSKVWTKHSEIKSRNLFTRTSLKSLYRRSRVCSHCTRVNSWTIFSYFISHIYILKLRWITKINSYYWYNGKITDIDHNYFLRKPIRFLLTILYVDTCVLENEETKNE